MIDRDVINKMRLKRLGVKLMKAKKVDNESMKLNNRELVFNTIYKEKNISKVHIAQYTGMSVMSAGRITDELTDLGLVFENDEPEIGSVGRPPKLITVNSALLNSVGILIDKNGVDMAITDPYGAILAQKKAAYFPVGADHNVFFDCIASEIEGFINENRHIRLLDTIGVVMPGLVNPKEGVLKFSSQFKWRNVPIRAMLSSKLPDFKFVMENDIKALAVAEHLFGQSHGCDNCVVLNIGQGIGAAALINNEIYSGENNAAGEIGHIVINPSGRMCECGKIGCLQANIAEWAILQEARSVKPDCVISDVFTAYERKERWAVLLVDRAVGYACIAINLLANTYSPKALILCGSLIRENPIFKELVLKNYKQYIGEELENSFEVKTSQFGKEGFLIGVSAIAFNQSIKNMLMG